MAPETLPAPSGTTSFPPQSLRTWYAVIQILSYVVFVGLCYMARSFETLYAEMEMRHLPFPTEVSVAISRFIRTPLGLILVAALGGALVVQGIRGKFDARLRRMIQANVIGTMALIAFYILSLYMPIVYIQRALKEMPQ